MLDIVRACRFDYELLGEDLETALHGGMIYS